MADGKWKEEEEEEEEEEEDEFKKLKKKKRKAETTEEEEEQHQGPSKSSRAKSSLIKNGELKTEPKDTQKHLSLEQGSPWMNLHLILLLQNKEIDIQRKLEVAFNFVHFRARKDKEDVTSCQALETVSISRVILFINNWIQSVLISSAKKTGDGRCEGQLGTSGSYLDYRCWVILKFCLEESLELNMSLSFSRDILQVIDCITRDNLIHLIPECIDSKESALTSERLEFQDIVLNCISLIFTCRGGILNENLDLWIMVVEKVLKLVQEVFKNKIDDHKAGVFILQFSCHLLEPFTKFLTVHPARKKGFHDFIDRLLEPLMCLLDELHLSTCKNPGWTGNLFKLVGEVLSQGIFHPTHIDGFLSLQSTVKYKTSNDRKSKERPIIIKSYHRHLFEKLQKIIALKNGLPLGGAGELLRLFVMCLTKQKGISSIKEGSDGQVLERISNSCNVALEKYIRSGAVNSETRKQVFDFFIQIMEHFISCIDSYTEAELIVGDSLSDVLCVFRSANKLLASFKNENIYVRTEDSSEGAYINFLRFIYQTVMSFSAKIKHFLLSMNVDNGFQKEVLLLVAKEIVVALHHLMDIGYEVVGDDLESLWVLFLTFTACSRSMVDVSDQHFLSLEILHLGCSLIDIYSELRQVNKSIFALSKAVKLLASAPVANEVYPLHFYSSFSNSLSSLICSAKFRLSICNAIKSIPEGQASGCIQLLTADISESLEWLKVQLQLGHANNLSKLGCGDSSFSRPNLETELVGRILAEVYTLVLDSMIVTAGNSIAVGRSIEKLMALMSYSSKGEDLLQPDIMDKFFCMVSGRTYCQGVGFDNDSLLCWLLVFFFRLYLSCRSLYREAISLVPPDTSIKMSETMGDFHTAYAGKDWLEGIIQRDEGYFSWIIKPSATFLSVIHNVSNICLQDSLAVCPSLVYVLIAMSIQRLVDLNGILNSFEYLLARNDKLVKTKLIDDTGMSLLHKRSKKWMKCLLNIKQEAAGLTKFMMSWLTLLVKDPILISFNNGLCENLSVHDLPKEIAWDLSVGSLNEKSLPSAIWWIVCQHVDIWCSHATKKDLKKFITNLIRSSLPFGSAARNRVGSHCINKLRHVKYVTIHQSSLELLNDTVLYEQRFFCRHIVSRIFRVLEASLTSSDSEEGYLISKPDWSEVIHSEILSNGLSNEKCAKNDQVSQINLTSRSLPKLHAEISRIELLDLSSNIKYALCSSLLNFLVWMPKEVLSSKSSIQLVTGILNVERVVVGNLLNRHKTLFDNDLFRLLLTCRRALKSLLASCDGKMAQDRSLLICILSESSSPVSWLLKSLSAVMGIQGASTEDSQLQDVSFSLMDQTSYVLLTISKCQFEFAMQFSGVGSDGKHGYAIVCQGTESNEDEVRSYLSSDDDPWRSLALLSEILREHKKSFCSRYNEPFLSEKFGALPEFLELRKLSSAISCIQGFLWGLAFALDEIDAENDKIQVKLSKCNMESLYKLNIFAEECAKSLTYFLHLLFLEGDADQSLEHARTNDVSQSGCVRSGKSEYKIDAEADDAQNCGPADDRGPQNIIGESDKRDVREKSHSENADVESLLADIELFDQHCLKRTLLQELLQGKNPEVAFFLKQLLLSASAIMRLKFKLNCNSLLENLIPALFGISQLLLVGFADMVAMPPLFYFGWLDGVVKFVEELGNCFPSSSPILSRKLYVKLIDLHLRCIGKCIALQGKRAFLASKESESSIKNPIELLSFSTSSPSGETCYLGNLKASLRMSFRALVQKSSELHLLSAVQAIERAIVGVQEGCSTNYEIYAGNLDGGKVTSTVAAGIDCLDLVIEFVTGRKRVKIVRRHIQGIVACLLNIILHLQGPSIFFESVNCNGGYASPDSGATILMCIDILRKVPGKHALFEMDPCHVGQFLNIPAALFQDLLQLQLFEVRHQSNSLSFEETIDTFSMKSIIGSILDRRYSLELYAACCRLLCSIVKHHASETQRCGALLQNSIGILLQCLEMVKTNSYVSRGNFAWEVQDGVRCACCLRRVYEEIRQQKDSVGRYCYQFLSGYIWIYCGFGPHKTGIIREVDEALRPGVYALIDACSADDLQRLHTAFGEGPCRSTLATLRNDYELYFQYEGKV